jgi:acetylglutamate kinase
LRVTVKLGGSILEDNSIRQSVLGQIRELKACGHEIILVHGGGKSLSRRLTQLGLESRFVGGLRVTDAATLGVALMVLAGEVNKNLVLELSAIQTRAVGICGADADSVRCMRVSDLPGNPPGIGFVGKPVTLDRELFDLLLGAGIVPVVASIAVGADSQAYNVNADQMASICAWGNGCGALVYLTDVPGVMGRDGGILAHIGKAEIDDLCTQGVITGGMLPKTASCSDALDHGVPRVYIVPGMARNILRHSVDGTLTEGTCIHGND